MTTARITSSQGGTPKLSIALLACWRWRHQVSHSIDGRCSTAARGGSRCWGKQSEADAVVEVDSQPGKQQFPAASLAIVALDSRELDQVAERVAAEEPGPVGDRRPIVGLVAGVSQPLPGLVEVVHVKAEVPCRARPQFAWKEVQFQAVPDRVPDQLRAQCMWLRDLRQAQHLPIEMAHVGSTAVRIWRRDMLKSAEFHEIASLLDEAPGRRPDLHARG